METTLCFLEDPPFHLLTLCPNMLTPFKFLKPLVKNLSFLLLSIKEDIINLFLSPADVLFFLFKNINYLSLNKTNKIFILYISRMYSKL